jgi:lysophospholipase L1-like esterase
MKTIVCFGDSNTWGCVPGSDGQRFSRDVRWPARLATRLGDAVEVISEGLSGRMATIEHPAGEGRKGLPYLLPCLHSHAPVDVLIIYLGTNDVAFLNAQMVARSVGRLIRVARDSEAGPDWRQPQVLVICPPPFQEHRLGPAFKEVCDFLDCELLDLDGVVTYSALDEIHLDEGGHIAVAAAVEERVRQMLS